MSIYVDRAKELRENPELSYNCSQAVVVPFIEEAGLDEEIAMSFAANFGGGMKRASVCGSITGGLMVLGIFGVTDGKTIAKYHETLKNRHNDMLECVDLLRVSRENGIPKPVHCNGMVYECVALVEDILREKGIID